MSDDKSNALGREALDRFAANLQEMADAWQINDDMNVRDMRATAKAIGLTALLRAALRLVEGGQ